MSTTPETGQSPEKETLEIRFGDVYIQANPDIRSREVRKWLIHNVGEDNYFYSSAILNDTEGSEQLGVGGSTDTRDNIGSIVGHWDFSTIERAVRNTWAVNLPDMPSSEREQHVQEQIESLRKRAAEPSRII